MSFFLREVALPLIIGVASSTIVVILGVKSIKSFIRTRERAKEIGELLHFWDTGTADSPFRIILGREQALDSNEIEPRFPYSEAFCIMGIREILITIFGKRVRVLVTPLNPESVLNPSFFEENLVIIGGEYSLHSFGKFCRSLKIPYYQYDLISEKRSFQRLEHNKTTETISSVVDMQAKSVKYDIGTVVRLINPLNGHLILLLNGNYAAGLTAAMTAITSPRYFPSKGFDPSASAQEILVGVSNIQDNLVLPEHPIEVLRGWLGFHVDSNAFTNAMYSATEMQNDKAV